MARGKPDPDPYLLAAQQLSEQLLGDTDWSTAGRVAIEDSLTGVTSALAAGLPTVGVPNILPLAPQPGLIVWSTLADQTVHDVAEVLRADRSSAAAVSPVSVLGSSHR